MKKLFLVAIIAAFFAVSCNNKDSRIVVDINEPVELVTQEDSLSWVLGFSLAQTIVATGFDVDRDILFKSIVNTLDSKQQPLTREQTMELMGELDLRIQMKQHLDSKASKEETNMREEAYFAKLVKDNPNVKKSDKGFYYEVLKEGKGPKGELGSVVVFDYKGSFTTGQVFDQTYGNREPITHVISESIFPGLFEGLQMMSAGSTYRFYFPSALGFGSRGTETIPPNSIIIYEVEVHDIHD